MRIYYLLQPINEGTSELVLVKAFPESMSSWRKVVDSSGKAFVLEAIYIYNIYLSKCDLFGLP